MTILSAEAVTIGEGHPDTHYPSWGYGHLVRFESGPRIGRMTRVFYAERLPAGTKVTVDTQGSLPRIVSLVSALSLEQGEKP